MVRPQILSKLTDNALLGILRESPLVKDAIKDAESTLATQRRDLVAKIKEIRKRDAAIVPKLVAEREAAERRFESARAAMKTAQDELVRAQMKLSQQSFDTDRQIRLVEVQLAETADRDAINAFVDEMYVMEEQERHSPPQREEYGPTLFRVLTGRSSRAVRTNHELKLARLKAIGEAIQEARALVHSPKVDLTEELARIRAGIPSSDLEPLPSSDAGESQPDETERVSRDDALVTALVERRNPPAPGSARARAAEEEALQRDLRAAG